MPSIKTIAPGGGGRGHSNIRGSFTGMSTLIRNIGLLDKRRSRKAARKIIENGAQGIRKDARRYQRRIRTGMLTRSIIWKRKAYRSQKVQVGIVGADKDAVMIAPANKSGNATVIKPVKYLHFIELGTKHHQAWPFMEPAYRVYERVAIPKAVAVCQKILLEPYVVKP